MLRDFDKITDKDISNIKFDYNLHSHNYLCGHATGFVYDYVKEAVKCNLKLIGISDHIESNKDFVVGWVNQSTIDEKYLTQFDAPKKDFGDKISILKGGEVEYFQNNYKSYENLLKRLDYLILGEHFFEYNGQILNISQAGISEDVALRLIDLEIEGVDTGYFSILAHPDMVLAWVKEITPKIKNHFEKLVFNAVDKGMLIEFNANGIRNNGFGYPTDYLVDLCKANGISVIVSSDCHKPEVMFDDCVKKLIFYVLDKGLCIKDYNEIRRFFKK